MRRPDLANDCDLQEYTFWPRPVIRDSLFIAAFISAIVVLAILLYSVERGVPASSVPLVTCSLALFGFYQLDPTGHFPDLYGFALLGLLAGFLLYPRPTGSSSNSGESWGLETGPILVAMLIVAAGVVWHFSATGIPLLQQNVETARFNFSSGLLGIPGRLYLFGAPLIWLLAVRHAANGGPRWISWSALAILVLSRLASGFKSALLEIVVLAFFSAAMSPRGVRVSSALRRYVLPLSVAVLFAFYVFGTYQTSQLTDQGAGKALGVRATSGVAVAGVHSMKYGELLLPTSALRNDLVHFSRKYSGLGASESFSYSERISASIYGTPLSVNSFIVPVTIGAIAEIYHDVGAWGAFAGLVFVGFLLGRCEYRARQYGRWWRFFAAISLFLALHGYVTKGGLVYNIFNWGAISIFIAIILIFVRLTTGKPGSSKVDS